MTKHNLDIFFKKNRCFGKVEVEVGNIKRKLINTTVELFFGRK